MAKIVKVSGDATFIQAHAEDSWIWCHINGFEFPLVREKYDDGSFYSYYIENGIHSRIDHLTPENFASAEAHEDN